MDTSNSTTTFLNSSSDDFLFSEEQFISPIDSHVGEFEVPYEKGDLAVKHFGYPQMSLPHSGSMAIIGNQSLRPQQPIPLQKMSLLPIESISQDFVPPSRKRTLQQVESPSSPQSPSDTTSPTDSYSKLVLRKERNKEIARKSRLRKKEYVSELEDRLKRLEAIQQAATQHVAILLNENKSLRLEAMALAQQYHAYTPQNLKVHTSHPSRNQTLV
eukprot:c6371_g1_i2.p1 GENE.c6371_g1_i2~~c6371_g1_i2.p1  ORF type:complete len:231 (+),score=48.17 c6371_g1_i2:51-695(+)